MLGKGIKDLSFDTIFGQGNHAIITKARVATKYYDKQNKNLLSNWVNDIIEWLRRM